MHLGGANRSQRDRDPIITLGFLLAVAIAFVVLWRLGVPLPLLISGLLLSCLLACLLFALVAVRSNRNAQRYLEALCEQQARGRLE